jgi:rSAM/selenodomain-associated transferase 2
LRQFNRGSVRLSVIIPTLNERERIAETVQRALVPGVEEAIVVDGGSRDDTVEAAAAAGARTLSSNRGRGVQQNAGARAAAGDTLLFLHADTMLPPEFPRHVAETLSIPGVAAGAFRFRLDERGLSMALVEWMVKRRCRLHELPYGDQAIFVRRAVFEEAGGFPDTPILEDYELVRRLQRLGRIAIADADAVTSARRWRRLGLLRTTWSNQVCLLAYRFDVSPERIARWREAMR